jgi:hypothetical protein
LATPSLRAGPAKSRSPRIIFVMDGRVPSSQWMGAYPLRIELPDHSRALLVRCRGTAHRAESRSPVLPLDHGWTGRRPLSGKVSWGNQGQEEGDSGCNPRCQLMIVNARPSDLRCQKQRLTSITQAVDAPSNRVLCRSIPYFLGPGRLIGLKILFLHPARAELIRFGKISPLSLFPLFRLGQRRVIRNRRPSFLACSPITKALLGVLVASLFPSAVSFPLFPSR